LQRKALDLYHHCLHVQEVTSHFAQSLGLPEEEKLLLELAARFHDIGKMAIMEELRRGAGTQFDPSLVDHFYSMSTQVLVSLNTQGLA
jgi:putative nucleotidyltransferase with HDIG domain